MLFKQKKTCVWLTDNMIHEHYCWMFTISYARLQDAHESYIGNRTEQKWNTWFQPRFLSLKNDEHVDSECVIARREQQTKLNWMDNDVVVYQFSPCYKSSRFGSIFGDCVSNAWLINSNDSTAKIEWKKTVPTPSGKQQHVDDIVVVISDFAFDGASESNDCATIKSIIFACSIIW